ncbi:hypothetical protein D7322_03660 [Sphingobacterium puteale]|uniref:Uncharacterized protein n=1 Tax=Sphingobacterium puteale TaxID=2420510 RepID=A0A420W311_9SPHI|nr:hypothetical protein D7322_03660 [Sphingobacterium puteale]
MSVLDELHDCRHVIITDKKDTLFHWFMRLFFNKVYNCVYHNIRVNLMNFEVIKKIKTSQKA